jgi:tetratricopeptide (TPR) repeat protein
LSRLALVVLFVVTGCGQSAERHFAEGDEHFEAKQYGQAADAYKKGLAAQPHSAPAWNRLGMTYRLMYNESRTTNLKKLEVDAFRRAVAADSTYSPALVNLGATLYYLGQKDEGAIYIRRSLEVNPNNPDRQALEALLADTPSSDRRNVPMASRPIEDVLKDHTPKLMALDGVVGTAQGEENGRPCIMVYLARDTEALRQAIPTQIEGYPVKLQVTGEITPLKN